MNRSSRIVFVFNESVTKETLSKLNRNTPDLFKALPNDRKDPNFIGSNYFEVAPTLLKNKVGATSK